jgi:hypothetical protein
VLPIIIIVLVAIPILVLAVVTVRRRTVAAEHPAGEDAAARAEIEREFAESERYQEEWRAEQRRHPTDDSLL